MSLNLQNKYFIPRLNHPLFDVRGNWVYGKFVHFLGMFNYSLIPSSVMKEKLYIQTKTLVFQTCQNKWNRAIVYYFQFLTIEVVSEALVTEEKKKTWVI